MLSFGATADGPWLGLDAARAAAAGLMFVRADSGRLDAAAGTVSLFIMRLLYPGMTSVAVSASAVAGRSGIDVMPLAVCAMSKQPGAKRVNPGANGAVELVEYGFRRGVAYDLMQLNPDGTDAVSFVVHPFLAPGQGGGAGAAAGLRDEVVGPHVCTGQLAITTLQGGQITVGRKFPIATFFNQLNSRFAKYDNNLCTSATAVVDRNAKQFLYNGDVPWMAATPTGQAAQKTDADGKLRTIADLLPAPAGTDPKAYGPLWAYAKAVPFDEWKKDFDEPAGGYATFGPGDWASLYAPAAPTAKNYPGTIPYQSTSNANYQAPPVGQKSLSNRRVLNVPLLDCPVAGGDPASATVLAIGKFLMTVPATSKELYAEFGGIAPEHTLGGPVELYR